MPWHISVLDISRVNLGRFRLPRELVVAIRTNLSSELPNPSTLRRIRLLRNGRTCFQPFLYMFLLAPYLQTAHT